MNASAKSVRSVSNLALTFSLLVVTDVCLLLSAELLAVRQLERFAGYDGGAVTVLVAVVGLSVALGYMLGRRGTRSGHTVREQLLWTLPLAAVFLVLALSPSLLEFLFRPWRGLGALSQAALYATGLLAFPMLCLGQGLPALGRTFARVTAGLPRGKFTLLSVCLLLVSCLLAWGLSTWLNAGSALLVALGLPTLARLPLTTQGHAAPLLLTVAVIGAAFIFTLA